MDIEVTVAPSKRPGQIMPVSVYTVECYNPDEINFGVIIEGIIRVMNGVLFESNNHDTRDRVVREVMKVCTDNHFTARAIRCNKHNNTPEAIDEGKLCVLISGLKMKENE